MKKHIMSWINNETVLSWPIVATENGSLYYEGKLVGVIFDGKKALRKEFAKDNGIELEDYNEEWGIIKMTQVIITESDKKIIASDCINILENAGKLMTYIRNNKWGNAASLVEFIESECKFTKEKLIKFGAVI